SQKPGFLAEAEGRASGSQKPGFLPKSSVGCQKYRRNPVSWMVGRASETGFLHQIGREDAKIIAETRFLGQRGCDF
ncbi:hypothetical protein, partial [Microcoleus sp. D3_18cC1]|uniref:hypothetical protein n=3 Tax=Microcoleus TaxID=44471 RepID=UPI002FD727B4